MAIADLRVEKGAAGGSPRKRQNKQSLHVILFTANKVGRLTVWSSGQKCVSSGGAWPGEKEREKVKCSSSFKARIDETITHGLSMTNIRNVPMVQESMRSDQKM